jgi:hypothetical protein
VNQSVTFTATVTGNPSGNIALGGKVSFADSVSGAITTCTNESLITSAGTSTAVCPISTLLVGTHTITATYANDTNFTGSSNTFTQTVVAATGSITLTSSSQIVSAGTYTSSVNAPVTFKATFPVPSGTTLSKTVSFTDNSVSISGCGSMTPIVSGGIASASCPDQALIAGTHIIVASYIGDTNLAVGNGSVTQQVSQSNSSMVLASSTVNNTSVINNPNGLNDVVTFTAAVSPSLTGPVPLSGTVMFVDNGTVISGCLAVPVTALGVATCTPAALGGGPNLIVATYASDSNFNGSNNTLTQNVQDFALATTAAPPVIVTAGFVTNTDPFSAQVISLTPVTNQGFATCTGTASTSPSYCTTTTAAPLKLTCSVTSTSGAGGTAPLCELYVTGSTTVTASTLAVTSSAEPSLNLVVDAKSATAGSYTVLVTGTDPTTGLVHTASFGVNVRAVVTLQLASGATTGNTGNVTFAVPTGVTLSGFSCLLGGSGITSPTGVDPAKFGVGCVFGSPMVSGNTVTLPVSVTTSGTIAALDSPHRSNLLLAGLLGIPFFGLFGLLRGRKRLGRDIFRLVAILVIGIAAFQTIGCGGSFQAKSGTSISGGGTTPPGIYYLLVQGTGSDTHTYQAQTVIQIDVLAL